MSGLCSLGFHTLPLNKYQNNAHTLSRSHFCHCHQIIGHQAATMKFSKSSLDCLVEKYNLSTKATSSLKDFKAQLTYLGSDVLNEEAFNVLLNNIGYERSREGLFESLLKEVAPAEADRLERFITVDDIAKLYGSDSYHLLDNGKDSGDSLMDHVDKSEFG